LEIDSEIYRDESIFDKRKVENNTIDYRLPIDSSNPGARGGKNGPGGVKIIPEGQLPPCFLLPAPMGC